MSKAQKFYLMAVVAFWGALIYAVIWGLVSWLINVPPTYEVTIGSFSITINRWFDVILFPLYLNLILSVYLWLLPVLERRGADHDYLAEGLFIGLGGGLDASIVAGLVAGLFIGLGAGLVASLVAGLVAGLVASIVAGLIVGLIVGPGAGFGASIVAGLIVGLVMGLFMGLGVGLVIGLGASLVALIVLAIKAIVGMHKRAFKNLSD